MTYVTVKEESDEKLHLSREPSARAWAIAVGMVGLGFGAAYSSVDDVIWKIAYVSGAVFIGLSWMEDWEDCIFDKSTGLVTIKKQSLIQRLFQATQGQRMVVAQLEDLSRVNVHEEEVSSGSMGYVVVLHFSQGYELGVTETVTAGDRAKKKKVPTEIRNFLNLVETGATTPMSETGPLDDNCSTTSDDSFEKIDSADIVCPDEESVGETGPSASTNVPPKENKGEDSNQDEEPKA